MKFYIKLLLCGAFVCCFSTCYFETTKKINNSFNLKTKDKRTLLIIGNTSPPETKEDITPISGVDLQEELSLPLALGQQNLSLAIINHQNDIVLNMASDLSLSNQDSLILKGFMTTKIKRLQIPFAYHIDGIFFEDLQARQTDEQTVLINSAQALVSNVFTTTPTSKDTLQDILQKSNALIELISSFPGLQNLDIPGLTTDTFQTITSEYLENLSRIDSAINTGKDNFVDSLEIRDTVINIGNSFLLTGLQKISSNNIVNVYHGQVILGDGTQLEFFAQTDPLPLIPIALIVGAVGTGVGTYAHWETIKAKYQSIKGRVFPKKSEKVQAQKK